MHNYSTQIAIVGSGPAGLSTAGTLRRAGYRTLILERGVFAHGVAGWPVYMKLFSTAELVELGGVPFIITDEKPNRQQYLRYLQRFALEEKLELLTRHEVRELHGEAGRFTLAGQTAQGLPFTVQAERVVLATGAYDYPNRLDCPGADLPHVSHYYRELNDYIGQRVLIVGGRHSATEAALELARGGVDVTLVHRGDAFRNLKYWIAPDLENRIKEGRIKAWLNTRVAEIRPGGVGLEQSQLLAHGNGEFAPGPLRRAQLEIDQVLALTGYRPDPEFLGRLGVGMDHATGQPAFNPETFESTRPGVYLAGVMLAGNISGAIFIENSRHHGDVILKALAAATAPAQ